MPPISRINRDVWLIGTPLEKITGPTLPLTEDVLRRFVYLRVNDGKSVQESAIITTKGILDVWNKTSIPYIEEHNIIKKVKKMHFERQNLEKNRYRNTKVEEAKRDKFLNKMTKLFDVARANALNTMKSDEDKAFYRSQRDGKRGHTPVIRSAEEAVEKTLKRIHEKSGEKIKVSDENIVRKNKWVQEQRNTTDVSESDSELSNFSNASSSSYVPRKKKRTEIPGKIILTEEICTALDRTKISDRNALYLLAATSQLLGENIDDAVLSRQSIRRERMRVRKKKADYIQNSFNPDVPLTVHWDGKLLPSLTSKKRVDRLAILVSGEGIEKLLGVPVIPSGTGEAQANAVHELLQQRNLQDRITSMCFDTTASNTGKDRGACILLEKKLGKELFSLACRHHIYELIVGSAFDSLFGPSSGPNIKLFQRFGEAWDSIDQDIRTSAIDDENISSHLTPIRDEMIVFLRQQLLIFQPRDDYKELLLLALVFLGDDPGKKIKIHAPGACHRARWMAKLIYCLKIYIFSSQNDKIHLKAAELRSLRQFNVFVVRVYLKKWYTCQCPTLASLNDLQMLNELAQYDKINRKVAEVTFKTFSRHLWYLGERLCGLALFDSRISIQDKQCMVMALSRPSNEQPEKRIAVDSKTLSKCQLCHFITENSKMLFAINNISLNFINEDPSSWEKNLNYIEARKKINQLKVVNDLAERGVSLIQSFNSVITKQEDQQQYLLQVVEQHRKDFPCCLKSKVIKRLNQAK